MILFMAFIFYIFLLIINFKIKSSLNNNFSSAILLINYKVNSNHWKLLEMDLFNLPY